MSIIRGDASEVYTLSSDLAQVGPKSVTAVRAAMSDAGYNFARLWAQNARETLRSDGHAYAYPDSIDSELVFDITGVSVDVGPNTAKKHGFLGRVLETGAEHSPPYLHGLRALDEMQGRAERIVDAAMGSLFQ